MKLDGRRESTNVDDRRGKSTGTKVGIGIGGTIVAALLALLLGGDPSSVIQSLNNQQSASAAEPYQPSAEEEELATFAKQILAGTEDVWTAEFKKMGNCRRPADKSTGRTGTGSGRTTGTPKKTTEKAAET